MAVKTSGNRLGWFSAVTVLLMDRGDTPLSIEQLTTLAARRVGPTARNDGYVTSRENGGDPDSYEAGWTIIVEELVALLREHGFLNGDLRWTGPTSGEVRWGGKPYVIRPADERQERRDYHMITLGKSADYGEVQIVGARGGITKKRLEVHPLAHLLPQIPRAELAELRKDIEDNGVLMPLLMFEDKVLDGRHRLYLAATLGRPVRLETFEGTEAEARARVGSLNLLRRHLKPLDRGRLALALFGEQAEEETAKAHEEGSRKGGKGTRDPAYPSQPKRGKTKAERVADMAGPGVSREAIQIAELLERAPETKAKVDAGEVSTLTGTEELAREEIKKREGKEPAKVDPWKTTLNTELGRMLSILARIRKGLDLGLGAEPAEIRDRGEKIITEMHEILDELERRSAI